MSNPLEELKKRLSRRDYRIIKLRVMLRLGQREIAQRVKLSQSRVSRIINKARRIARAIEAEFRRLDVITGAA